MASYTFLYHPKVVRDDLPRLDRAVRERVREAIEGKLSDRPEEHAKPLAYTAQGLWSLRVGSWRVVFALRGEELWILKIGHRRDVYEDLQRPSVSSD